MLYVLLFISWLIGAVSIYVLDGYYDFGFKKPETPKYYASDYSFECSIFWPIIMWVVMAKKLRLLAETARQRRLEQEKEVLRIRVVEEKKNQQIELEASREAEEFFQEIENQKVHR